METSCLEVWVKQWQSSSGSEETGVLVAALENPWSVFIHTTDRTHNRIRSPRLAASGR
jgi:hypothetical protein